MSLDLHLRNRLVSRVKNYPLCSLLVLAALAFFSGCASPAAKVESNGADTYTITKEAATGFTRDTGALKEQALAEAQKFCADRGKQLKVVAVTEDKPLFYTTSFASAKVVFKALDAGDSDLHAPAQAPVVSAPATPGPTGDLYNELIKLDELRTRGLLTDKEFQSEKKKLIRRSH